jgi:predicted dehydrogenase
MGERPRRRGRDEGGGVTGRRVPEPVRAVGVVGLGMGRAHARAWRELGVRVAWVCDTRRAVADACAREVGARAAYDIAEVLADHAVRAVSIATPDHLHADHARAALAAGKHVMLEKPMVTTLADARMLVRLSRMTGLTLAVGNVNRFVPQFAHVRHLAASGHLGRLFHVEADYIHDMRDVYRRTPWRRDRKYPQNFWIGGGVHPMDLLRWVGGEIRDIHVRATRMTLRGFPLDSDFIATVGFASGATGKLWVTAGIRRRPEHVVRLNAYGTKGSVETDFDPVARRYLHREGGRAKDWSRIRFRPTTGHPVREELRHFLACIRTGDRPMVDAEDGARTVAALSAGLRSARLGLPVAVPPV